jgi:hypothetical protein
LRRSPQARLRRSTVASARYIKGNSWISHSELLYGTGAGAVPTGEQWNFAPRVSVRHPRRCRTYRRTVEFLTARSCTAPSRCRTYRRTVEFLSHRAPLRLPLLPAVRRSAAAPRATGDTLFRSDERSARGEGGGGGRQRAESGGGPTDRRTADRPQDCRVQQDGAGGGGGGSCDPPRRRPSSLLRRPRGRAGGPVRSPVGRGRGLPLAAPAATKVEALGGSLFFR